MTLNAWSQGNFSYWDLAGLLPLIPGAVARSVDDVADAAKYADNVGDLAKGICSFSADTVVVTEAGVKPISEVGLYDKVLAYDEVTGEIGYYPVLAVWAHEDPIVVELTLDGEVVETTPEHPFYTAAGEWVAADSLQVGDEIRQADWAVGTVEAITFTHQPQLMYNFTVATAHTYFVGDRAWLVHNSCGKLIGGASFTNYHSLLDAGRTVGTKFDNHHWIPQSFHKRLQNLYPGLTLQDLHFTEPLEDGFHSYLHGKGAKGTLQEAYNGQVRRWLDTNPSASQAEFLEEVNRLRDEYMALYASYIIGQ